MSKDNSFNNWDCQVCVLLGLLTLRNRVEARNIPAELRG